MMTKIKFAIVVTTLFMATSCNKFLDTDPPDNLVHSEYWQNRDQAYASLIGMYTSLHNCLNSFHVWGDIRSGLYAPGSGESFTSAYAQFLSHDIYSDNGLLSWASVYTSITWINSFIKNAPQVPKRDNTFSEAELNIMLGEAHALRALNYFYLVRAFKDVPLINEPYESDMQKFNTAASLENEVLDFIEEDLEYALQRVSQTFENANDRYGRITKNAVRALWADVKLWRNDYQACLALCTEIDGQYASSLLPALDWYSIFSPGNSSESIFEYQYSQTGIASPLYNWFASFSSVASGKEKYLANISNVNINSEMLYPPASPEYATSDTIRLKSFSMLRRTPVSIRYNSGDEVNKFLGTAPYQVSYRQANSRNANYYFYRYREILLMKAEALAMLNRYSEAEEMINQIREHCDIPLLTPGEAGTGEEFFNRLLMEREFELGFEGKEWFATVRISRREGLANVLISKAATNNSMGRSYQVIRARLLDKESWFLPYHKTELENNTQLKQKDFYINK